MSAGGLSPGHNEPLRVARDPRSSPCRRPRPPAAALPLSPHSSAPPPPRASAAAPLPSPAPLLPPAPSPESAAPVRPGPGLAGAGWQTPLGRARLKRAGRLSTEGRLSTPRPCVRLRPTPPDPARSARSRPTRARDPERPAYLRRATPAPRHHRRCCSLARPSPTARARHREPFTTVRKASAPAPHALSQRSVCASADLRPPGPPHCVPVLPPLCSAVCGLLAQLSYVKNKLVGFTFFRDFGLNNTST